MEIASAIEAPRAESASWNLVMPVEIGLGLIALWLLVSTWRLLSLARQCLALRAMKFRARAVSEELEERFEALRGEMGVRRRVGIALCSRVGTPIAAGFFRPLVLLPIQMSEGGNPSRLDGILRHELAHIRRWDDWTNLIQQVVQALFFFHPGVCWLSRRLTLEREIACDDHALAAISSRRDYALLLAEFASRMQCREWAAAPGAWSKKGQLKERINMIMNGKRNASTRLAGTSAGMLTVGAALVALLVMQMGPRVAFADEPNKPETTATAAGAAEPPTPPAVAIAGTISVETDSVVSVDGKNLAVVSGPRKKPGTVIFSHPVSAPDIATVADVRPVPPRPPEPPRPPRRAGAGADEGDLERRLERLERLVERLERRGPVKGEMHFDLKEHDFDPKFQEKMGRMHRDFVYKFNKEDMERVHEEARRAGERAAKDAENIRKEVERGMKDFHFEGKPQARVEIHPDAEPKERKKALENQRQALERQVQAVERQIEEIERQEDRAERDRERAEEARERAREARERADEQRARAEERKQRSREGADKGRDSKSNDNSNDNSNNNSNDNSNDNSTNTETPKKRKQ